MSNLKYVQISFDITEETGVISFLMLNGGKLGLLYNKKFERNSGYTREVIVYYTGETDFTDEEIKKSFEKHSGVIEVTDISIVDRADMRRNPRPDSTVVD